MFQDYRNITYKSDIKDIKYNYCSFFTCKFIGITISGSDFSHSKFINCVFVNCTIDKSNFRLINLINCEIKDCKITNTDFTGSILNKSKITSCNIHTCNFTNNHYTDAIVENINYNGCKFNGSDFGINMDLTTCTFDFCSMTVFTGKPLLSEKALVNNNFQERSNYIKFLNYTGEYLELNRNNNVFAIPSDGKAEIVIKEGAVYSCMKVTNTEVINLPKAVTNTIYIVTKQVYDILQYTRTDVGYYDDIDRIIII